MVSKVAEIAIRENTKHLFNLLKDGKLEEAKQVLLAHKETLSHNLGLVNFLSIIPRVRFSKIIPKNQNALRMLIDTGFEIHCRDGNVSELFFFAAAKCDVYQLENCVKIIVAENPDDVNQTRDGDTVLMFMIKYGNLGVETFPKCIELVIEAGVDVNKPDYSNHVPIMFLINLYNRYTEKVYRNEQVIGNLRKSIKVLLDSGSVDLTSHSIEINPKDFTENYELNNLQKNIVDKSDKRLIRHQAFKFLIELDEEGFKNYFIQCPFELNLDDGNNTLLQLCCEKNLKIAAQFLIDNGADLHRTTSRNSKHPIEIAARRNNLEIFHSLMRTKRIVFDRNLFLIFLCNRGKQIKTKYFDELLKYSNLDVNIQSNNGNTPLHYAIIFSNSEAIQLLLRRGASLIVENEMKKCPLDYISPADLEKYLDSCILPDTYNKIDHGKYEVALNYRSLLQNVCNSNKSELAVVEKISNTDRIKSLLSHPLLSSFIDIKWQMVDLSKNWLILHLLFHLISVVSNLMLNSVKNYCSNKLRDAKCNWKREIAQLTMVLILGISIFVKINVVQFCLGAILTLATIPVYWALVQKFSNFSILSLYFAVTFYVISFLDFDKFKLTYVSFYMACAMTAVLTMTILIETAMPLIFLKNDIRENLEAHIITVSQKYILLLLICIEKIYLKKGRKAVAAPFIFDDSSVDQVDGNGMDQDKADKRRRQNRANYLVNFYLNLNKFSMDRLRGVRLNESSIEKIKKLVHC